MSGSSCWRFSPRFVVENLEISRTHSVGDMRQLVNLFMHNILEQKDSHEAIEEGV